MTPANGSFSSSVSVFHNPIASNQELLAEEEDEEDDDDDVPPLVENQEVDRLLRGFLIVLDPARIRSSQWRGRPAPSTACTNQSISRHHPTSCGTIIVVMVLVCLCVWASHYWWSGNPFTQAGEEVQSKFKSTEPKIQNHQLPRSRRTLFVSLWSLREWLKMNGR